MSITLKEQIMQNLKTTLEGVDGFSSSTVRRFKQVGLTYNVVPVIDLMFQNMERIESINRLTTYEMQITIGLYNRDETDNTEQTFDLIESGIIKAVMEDQTQGGLALKTEIQSIEPFPTDIGQPECLRLINLLILFRTNYKNHEIKG